MLRINRYKSTLTVSLLFCLLSTMSCGFEDDYEDNCDDVVRVAFKMSFADSNTRAVNEGWGDYNPTDPGVAYENAINPDQLQIKVCDVSGNIIADVENVIAIKGETDGNYTITGTWEDAADKLTQAKKIMVFANCGPTNVTQSNIASLAFNKDDTKQYIPMWGVTTLGQTLQIGKSNDLGTIYLLRSLAKVKVKMKEGMKARDYSLGEITFNNYNTRGYTLPATYNTASDTKQIFFNNSLRPLASLAAAPIAMTNSESDEESIMLYIPEYDNKGAATDKKATITLNLKCEGKDDGTYTLQFCNYTDGAPDPATLYNIQRNHYYEYTVYKDDGVKISLTVKEWNKRTHSDIIM